MNEMYTYDLYCPIEVQKETKYYRIQENYDKAHMTPEFLRKMNIHKSKTCTNRVSTCVYSR